MATDIATLAIKVENSDVGKATASLHALTGAGATSEAAARRNAAAFALLGDQAGKTAAQIRGALTSELAARRKAFAGEVTKTTDRGALQALQEQIVKTREMGQAAKACGLEIKRWTALEQQVAVAMNGGAAAIKNATAATNGLAVNTPKAERATQNLTRRMALLQIEAQKMDAALTKSNSMMGRLSASFGGFGGTAQKLQAAMGALAGAFALRELAGLADTYTNIQSRLRLVTTGTENLAGVQAALFEQAQRTRSSFEATADTYVKFARAANTLGASQRDILGVTETINKAMIISGGSAESNRAALIQLGQAMASGALQGEELRSVLEQAPRLADAIAAGMGVAVGELRKLAKEGKVTSQEVFAALQSQRSAIDAEFAQMPKTIGGAMQQIRNEILNTIGGLDQMSGASGGLVEALDGIRKAIGPVARATSAFFGGWAIASADAAIAVEKITQGVLKLQAGMARALQGAGFQKLGDWLFEGAAKGLKDGDDTVRLLEKQRDAIIERVHAITAAGNVSTTPIGKPPKAVVDPQALKDLDAIQDATDKYYDTLNQNKVSAFNTAATTREETAAIEAMTEAYRQGPAAVEAMRVAQAGETAVKELGIGVTDRMTEAVRRNAEARERAVIAQDKVKDAQADAAREAERQADEAQRQMERRAHDIHRATVSTIEGIFTDIANKKNPLIALADGFKRAMIRSISEALATKLEAKFGDLLGIQMPGTKIEKGGTLINQGADKILRAAEMMNDTVPGDGLAERRPSTMPKDGSVAMEQFKKAMGIGGSALGGYTAGYGIGQATRSGTAGALGGAASGALTGAMIAGPVGAAVGGIAGFVGGIIGAGDAARAAAERMRKAKEAFDSAFDAAKAQVAGDDLALQIAQTEAQFDQLRDALKESSTWLQRVIGTELGMGEYANTLDEVNALQAERVRQLQEEAAIQQKRGIEDYAARLAAATPGNERQEAIEAFNRGKDRELEDLKRRLEAGGWEAWETATYEMAQQAIAAEKAKNATEALTGAFNGLTTSVKNAPSGFKLEGSIQQYAKGAPYPGQFQMPVNPFVPPMSPTGNPTLSSTVATAPVTIQSVVINTKAVDGKTIAREFLGELDRVRNSTGGLNGSRGAALEVMKTTGTAWPS
jgi:tape measure domain-containing protein